MELVFGLCDTVAGHGRKRRNLVIISSIGAWIFGVPRGLMRVDNWR